VPGAGCSCWCCCCCPSKSVMAGQVTSNIGFRSERLAVHGKCGRGSSGTSCYVPVLTQTSTRLDTTRQDGNSTGICRRAPDCLGHAECVVQLSTTSKGYPSSNAARIAWFRMGCLFVGRFSALFSSSHANGPSSLLPGGQPPSGHVPGPGGGGRGGHLNLPGRAGNEGLIR
jgi:hypothetical protein